MNGLFLGKFAPLHKGHQYVIETALDEVDTLNVLIYDCPEVTDVPLTTRCEWFDRLYPGVNVIPAWTGPTQTGYTEEIMRMHEEYVLGKIDDIDVFYSSEPYGHHMSEALDAENRVVDMDRETIPISATEIRQDTYGNKEYIDPYVYRDLITNVVFLGGPSTGKSTLTKRLALEYNTVRMPEYGREYWMDHQIDNRLTKKQLLELAEGHEEREDKHLEVANEYLFTDTNALTTYIFSEYYHGDWHPLLYQMARESHERYDEIIVCDTDIPFEDTWDRSGPGNRERMQKHTLAFLEQHNVPYTVVSGSVDERVDQVKDVLHNS